MNRFVTYMLRLLAALVVVLGLLAVDLAWRVWDTRAAFDGADVPLLLTLEITRAAATLAAVWLALLTLRRREAGSVAFATFLLFLGLWYAKATAVGFPGYLQERMALALIEAGVPQRVLVVLFGAQGWALPPAVAGFVAFALQFPRAPDPTSVRAAHATGRRGTLRGVALAGTDVRSLLHRAAAWVLERGWLRPATLAAGGLIGAPAMLLGGPAVRVSVAILMLAATACAFAYLRTAWLTTEDEQARIRLGRLGTAALVTGAGLVAGGALGFLPGAGMARIALTVTSVAPLAVVALLMRFVWPSSAEIRPA